jgi:hypothetical protein
MCPSQDIQTLKVARVPGTGVPHSQLLGLRVWRLWYRAHNVGTSLGISVEQGVEICRQLAGLQGLGPPSPLRCPDFPTQ